jgi:AraC family transcriptional regulator
MEYIHEHLSEDLSLREIAAFLQMSPNYFTSLFKQSTGLSAHQYVIHCRIEKAERLLTKSDLSIVEVAQQVGFQSQSHFVNVFRKQTGMTPKTYRKARK